MTAEGTKESILNTALDLFSQKGYAAVSMRDISGAVGIRTSSIYYYFKSKQDIFDALIEKAEEVTNGLTQNFFVALGKTKEIKCKDFVNVGKLYVTGYLNNDKVDKLLKTLECERFHDEKADQIWRKMLFEDPIVHAKAVFDELIKRGMIKDKDAGMLASEYHAIIMLGYFTNDIDKFGKMLTLFHRRTF
ncbi:MAG: TetR/AcrR family transcriptional regulator [Clostridiales bacterium]|nr:TetR/AcrR family transcriptional regulator [Clostridiales bacterium]